MLNANKTSLESSKIDSQRNRHHHIFAKFIKLTFVTKFTKKPTLLAIFGVSVSLAATFTTNVASASTQHTDQSNSENSVTWYGEVGIGFGYDSNVTVDELELNSRLGDNFRQYDGKLGLTYDIMPTHTVDVAYKASAKQYQDNDYLDLNTDHWSVDYQHKASKFTYGIQYRHIDTDLDSYHFLRLRTLSPYVSRFLAKQHFVRMAWTHTDKKLIEQPERDATSNQFAVHYYYFMQGLKRFWVISYRHKNENAIDTDVSFTGNQVNIAYEYRFNLWQRPFKARVNTQYRHRDYHDAFIILDTEQFDGVTANREDKRKSVRASLTTEITDETQLKITARYLDNESDLASLNYNETQLNAHFSYQF